MHPRRNHRRNGEPLGGAVERRAGLLLLRDFITVHKVFTIGSLGANSDHERVLYKWYYVSLARGG
jgi:hypothetical protein